MEGNGRMNSNGINTDRVGFFWLYGIYADRHGVDDNGWYNAVVLILL